MTTLVMVEKDGLACMAAETLSSFGERKQSARYVARPEKIIRVDETYVGIVGWAAHQDVLASAFANGFKMPLIVNERDLFELSRTLHKKLKDDYFLNPHEERDDPYESSQMTLFIMNRHGLFALYSLRAVDRFKRFAAVGSGSHYALGAMYAVYEHDLSAPQIARIGVRAGIEFDHASLGPVTLRQVRLDQ